jgi:hypothetical protein
MEASRSTNTADRVSERVLRTVMGGKRFVFTRCGLVEVHPLFPSCLVEDVMMEPKGSGRKVAGSVSSDW